MPSNRREEDILLRAFAVVIDAGLTVSLMDNIEWRRIRWRSSLRILMLSDMAAGMAELEFEGPVNGLFPSATFMATTGHAVFRGPHSRREALRLAAEEFADRPNMIDIGPEQEALQETLLTFKGVGHWIAAYVAMRVLGTPDVLPPNDAAIQAGAPGYRRRSPCTFNRGGRISRCIYGTRPQSTPRAQRLIPASGSRWSVPRLNF